MIAFIEAIFFALSSGLLFNDRIRSNKPLLILTRAIALISSYLLFEEMAGRLIRKELQSTREDPRSGQESWLRRRHWSLLRSRNLGLAIRAKILKNIGRVHSI